jgi:hypothetical protein
MIIILSRNRISIIGIFLFFIFPIASFSQTHIKGKVIYGNDAGPASAVSIEVLNQKGLETITNNSGEFSLHIPNPKNTDTLVISSVGYKSLKLPVSSAAKRTEFLLTENTKDMESVTIFSRAQVLGSATESIGYFRSWNFDKKGGEIGRLIKTPFKEYKIDKVRFKAANFCDVCLLRLRIRNVINGKPGEDILQDSISLNVNDLTLEGKVPEFDLTPYNYTFKDKEVFVSIEVISCSPAGKNKTCSFSFAGTEQGAYMYKSSKDEVWNVTDDHTIYLKLFLRY